MNVLRWIRDSCCRKKCSREKYSRDDIRLITSKKLERWKVQMYANNPHLMKIPEKRIDEMRNQIFDELCLKYDVE